MPSSVEDFFFDVNYSFGEYGIFTDVNMESGIVPPPITGFFKLLDDGSPFLLLDDNSNLLLLG